MSALIQTIFILVGHYAGKTINLGGYQFTEGKLTLNATPEDTALVARSLERNWSAFPKGHPALEPKESDNGKRDLSPDPLKDGQPPVHGAVQSNGEGAEAGGEAGNGGGDAGAEAGKAAELAGGDGQPAGVSADAQDSTAAAGAQDPKPEVNTKLVKAIGKLDPKDDSHWTEAGLAAMKAVEGFYGSADITRADVEAAAPGLTRATAPAPAKK